MPERWFVVRDRRLSGRLIGWGSLVRFHHVLEVFSVSCVFCHLPVCSPVGFHTVVHESCQVKTVGAGLREWALQEWVLSRSRELKGKDFAVACDPLGPWLAWESAQAGMEPGAGLGCL